MSVLQTICGGVSRNIKTKHLMDLQKKYHWHKLVYFEEYSEVNDAIARKKQLKGWVRAKKNWLIESQNPNWND